MDGNCVLGTRINDRSHEIFMSARTYNDPILGWLSRTQMVFFGADQTIMKNKMCCDDLFCLTMSHQCKVDKIEKGEK